MSPNPMDRINAMKGQIVSGLSEDSKAREDLRKPVESIEMEVFKLHFWIC
jgi:hypothetical protein